MSHSKNPFQLQFLKPRYWLMWLAMGLLRLGIMLPFGWQLAIGRRLGRRLRPLSKRRLLITRYNLRTCLPELSEAERDALERRQFEALGIALFEIGLCWWGSARRLRKLVRIEGQEYLEAAKAQGRGVILLSAHVTCLEIGGRLLGLYTPFHLMYRPNNNPALEWLIRGRRETHFERAIPRDSVRALLGSLKAGYPVWYAPDQGFTGKYSEMVPFFGVPAPTNTATSRIARASGAPVLPFQVERLPGSQGYLLRVEPPLEDFPTEDALADARRVNKLIEVQARRAPEQYLWAHNRFKNRDYKRSS